MIFQLGTTSFDAGDVETTSVRGTFDSFLARTTVCIFFLPTLYVLGYRVFFEVYPDIVREFFQDEAYSSLPEQSASFLFFFLIALFLIVLNYISARSKVFIVRLRGGTKIHSNQCSDFLAKSANQKLLDAKNSGSIVEDGEKFMAPASGPIRLRDVLGFEAGPSSVATIIAYCLVASAVVRLYIDPPTFDFSKNGLMEALELIVLPMVAIGYFFIGGYWVNYIFAWENGKLLKIKQKMGNREDIQKFHCDLLYSYEKRTSAQA